MVFYFFYIEEESSTDKSLLIPCHSFGLHVKIKLYRVRIKGCQELASHGVVHFFLFKAGATPDLNMPIWAIVRYRNEKKMIEKIWDKDKKKRGRKMERKG